MFTYQREYYEDCVEEFKKLFSAHWEEVAYWTDKIKLNPDFDEYELLDDVGSLFIFTAREKGELVGYSVYFVKSHIHYADKVFAYNDIVYLKPEYRKAKVGLALLSYSEKVLEREGVDVVMVSMKDKLPFHELMLGMEYEPYEHTYAKYIGE